MRQGNWKLIEFMEDGALELYNLESDPNEVTNLAQTHPEKAQELRKGLVAWRVSIGAQRMTENPDYDPARDKEKKRRPRMGKGVSRHFS